MKTFVGILSFENSWLEQYFTDILYVGASEEEARKVIASEKKSAIALQKVEVRENPHSATYSVEGRIQVWEDGQHVFTHDF